MSKKGICLALLIAVLNFGVTFAQSVSTSQEETAEGNASEERT